MPASPQPAQHQDRQPGREHKMTPEPDYAPRFSGSGRLAGKVALITGGDSGIGRAVAVLFAREVPRSRLFISKKIVTRRTPRPWLKPKGVRQFLFRGNVGLKEFCKEAVDETVRRFGRLDVVVNNAAEQHIRKEIEAVAEEDLEEVFRTNLFGYFFMIQAVLPHLKSGAAIVNTASITAYEGHPELLDYSATKGAIISLTRALARRLADKGIRVNAVAPGPIWTPLIPASFPEEAVAKFGQDTPLGRAGQPNEVAPAFLLLACEDGSYLTGQTIHPNGGRYTGT